MIVSVNPHPPLSEFQKLMFQTDRLLNSNEQRLCNQNDRAGCGNAGIEWHKYSEKQYRRCRYSEDEYRLARYSG